MWLYSPDDLTGNVNMIEKLVLGGTGTGDLPILSLMRHQVTILDTLSPQHMILVTCEHVIKINYSFKFLVYLLSMKFACVIWSPCWTIHLNDSGINMKELWTSLFILHG